MADERTTSSPDGERLTKSTTELADALADFIGDPEEYGDDEREAVEKTHDALAELRQRAEQRDRMREALERILGYAENNDEQRINDRFDAIHRIARAALAGLSQPGKDEA